jgi:YesN/AraC family two-component response regulator
MKGFFRGSIRSLPPDYVIVFYATFNQTFDEVLLQSSFYQFKACSGVLTMIAEILFYEQRQEQSNHYKGIVEKAKYLMEANSYTTINIPAIAEQIGISASKLNEIFKAYTAMTPYQYYNT